MTAPSNYPSEQTGDGARSRGWLTRPCKRAGSSSAGKPAGQRRRGGSAYAIQPHREVRPESGLSVYEVYDMKACRILTPFWAIGEGDEEEEEKGRGRQGASYDHSSYRIVGVRIYPLTLASAWAQHLVRWGEGGK